MSLSEATREKIENHLKENRVVLFMKGTPQQPMCGFSSRTVSMLDSLLSSYGSVDVLQDSEIREGIKEFGNWPTIPQLYIDGELMGGCDIVSAMFNSGELHEALGQEAPDRTPPEVTITDAAAENIRAAMTGNEGAELHFHVDAGWQSQFTLGPAEGHELRVESNGITLLLDLASAQRASGATIDWVSSIQGEGLAIELPKAPAPVKQMAVKELKERLDKGNILVVDVRPADERARAYLEESKLLDKSLMEELEAMPKDTGLAFICHTGNRSNVAAEHFRKQGFTDVSNVAGGINAWALEIDTSIPRY
jgi:monothiol glutaredoxin